ncbi:putative methionine--tRNA ligase, cytoplasmic protein rar1 [Quaeritorhiza haematococci]|nr:putative methionine--tRNA ligase, cytoplasmic protein rar1 [Quaeritorhiza haematococci]
MFASDSVKQAEFNAWLEYDDVILKPAILSFINSSGEEGLAAALARLESAAKVSQGHAIFKDSPVPDLMILATLYPAFGPASSSKAADLKKKFPSASKWFDETLKKEKSLVDGAVQLLKKAKADAASSPSSSASSQPAPKGKSKKEKAADGASKDQQPAAKKPKVQLPPPIVKKEVVAKLDHHSRTVLPESGKRNILITSALPYVNNVPHLGNIIGCVLSADVYARYCRLRSYNVLYVCGTDEYGTATETKALEEGVSCQALCDKYHALHRSCYEWFGIDFDYFGRTTTKAQTEIAQDIFLKADKNGYTLEETMTQLYCEKHQSFLADRFVEGTCPHCSYPDARGDQCDACGKLLNATELIKPLCKLCGVTPIPRDSRHIFLDLGKLQGKCETLFKQSSTEGQWSENGIHITNSWLKEGLKPRCITRDLKWGTPVPKKGFEKKVFYVWFDAPIGYLSITANYSPDGWRRWWKQPSSQGKKGKKDEKTEVKLYQFMGKDNVPFHTVIFPCSLMATGEDWTLLHHVSTTEYLQYENGKFSKSRGVGVFGNNVMDSGIPVEVWRYYLLSNRPETADSQFTWSAFAAANNSELLANFGNLVNRVVKFLIAKYESVVPEYRPKSGLDEPEKKLIEEVNALLTQYVDALESVKLRLGLKLLMDISARGNAYLQENRLDNNLFANNRSRCDAVVGTAINLAYLLSALCYPYMPTTSESICRQLNLPVRSLGVSWDATDVGVGHRIGEAEYLFKRIEESTIEELRKRYSGKQSEQKEAATSNKKKSSKSSSAASSAPGPLNEAPAGITKTPAIIDLEKKIKEQGDAVRKLKTDKAAPEEVKKAVEALLGLKKQLGEEVAKVSSSAPAAAAKPAAAATPAPASSSSKKKAQAAAASSSLNEAPEGVTKTPAILDLEKKIKDQGDKVRKLKGDKAPADEVKKAVEGLLDLKKKLGEEVAKASS